MNSVVGKAFRTIGGWIGRGSDGKDSARTISFLHIGKTAGTQIARVIERVNEVQSDLSIIKHRHRVVLADLPADREFFFSIRDPAARFMSGFYSRQRRGRPHYDIPWTPSEERAFGDFEHANDLAEALFDEGGQGSRAFAAMKSISHVSMDQTGWFCRYGHFLSIRPPLAIIRQEHFRDDLQGLLDRIGITVPLRDLTGEGRAHQTDYAGIPELSDKALDNLRLWYRQDMEFYRQCVAWMEETSKVPSR